MGFWVALADPAAPTTRLAGTERELSPAPHPVVYPEGMLGQSRPTDDGRLIVQQPTRDNRVREWHWTNFPTRIASYEDQFHWLSSLRSRYRQDVGTGSTPYVFVKDDTTDKLRRKVQTQLTAQSSGNSSTTLTFSGTPFTGVTMIDGMVEVLPATAGGTGTGAYQRRNIISNTASAITVSAWTTIPDGARVTILYWLHDWFRARVIDVDRKLADTGDIRYADTWFRFVIEDSNFNDLG